MPEILRLFGLIFSIYTRDHQPPMYTCATPTAKQSS